MKARTSPGGGNFWQDEKVRPEKCQKETKLPVLANLEGMNDVAFERSCALLCVGLWVLTFAVCLCSDVCDSLACGKLPQMRAVLVLNKCSHCFPQL